MSHIVRRVLAKTTTTLTMDSRSFPRYGEACLERSNQAVMDSDFCKCLWSYKERYEDEVGCV